MSDPSGNLSPIMKRATQLSLTLPSRGGRRRGAGRKPKGPRSLVSHRARPRFEKPTPVLVTMRVERHVWNLRCRRCFRAIAACFETSLGRFWLRLIEFSVLGNHLHPHHRSHPVPRRPAEFDQEERVVAAPEHL